MTEQEFKTKWSIVPLQYCPANGDDGIYNSNIVKTSSGNGFEIASGATDNIVTDNIVTDNIVTSNNFKDNTGTKYVDAGTSTTAVDNKT